MKHIFIMIIDNDVRYVLCNSPLEKKMATVTAHRELTVSSPWAHSELTVSSRWPTPMPRPSGRDMGRFLCPRRNVTARYRECAVLTHWGRDKMAAISQTTVLNAFSWMKMIEFWLKFHLSFFLRVQLTIIQHFSDNGLAPVRRQAIIWTNDG